MHSQDAIAQGEKALSDKKLSSAKKREIAKQVKQLKAQSKEQERTKKLVEAASKAGEKKIGLDSPNPLYEGRLNEKHY